VRGTTWKGYGLTVVCALALTIAACGSDDGENVTGNWSGPAQDTLAGTGTISATISQSADRLQGIWSVVFQNSASNSGGNLSGMLRDQIITLTLSPTNPAMCTLSATLTKRGDDHYSGQYVGINCTLNETGMIDITKQK
jgi:hypothetical protein